MCVSEPVLSQDCKNDIFMRCLKMLKIAIWKNDLIYGYRFWAMFAKHRYIHLKFGMPDVQAWFYNILYVVFRKNLEILDFVKSYIQILFFTFWVKKSFFGESEIGVLKNFLVYGFCCFILAFCLKYLYLVIFQTPIFDEKWRDIGSLKSV